MLKAHGKELLTRSKRGLMKNHTSGTTGTPLTVFQDWASVWREQAYFVCYRKRCGYNYGEPMVSLRGNLGRSDISLKVHVSNTLFLSSYNINEHTAMTYYQLIKQHHAKAIEGYPSSLYNLALVLHDKGLEESFDHDGYFEDPGYGIEEYYDDYVISTSLINDVFPLIRYKTTDCIVPKQDCFPLHSYDATIESIEGRAASNIVGKDGTRYSDAALTFIFKDVSNVRKAQFIQNELGKVTLNIVPDRDFKQSEQNIILSLIDEKMGLRNIDVDIQLINEAELKYTKRNKLALVISNL